MDKTPFLCSECDPDIGKWHGRFAKRSAEGMFIDQSGNLWSKDQVDGGAVPKHYTIMGQACAVTAPASEPNPE